MQLSTFHQSHNELVSAIRPSTMRTEYHQKNDDVIAVRFVGVFKSSNDACEHRNEGGTALGGLENALSTSYKLRYL